MTERHIKTQSLKYFVVSIQSSIFSHSASTFSAPLHLHSSRLAFCPILHPQTSWHHASVIPKRYFHLTHQTISCLLGNTFVNLEELLSLKQSWAGFGLLVSKFTIPAGNESIISPESFTWHLKPYLLLIWAQNQTKRESFFWVNTTRVHFV